MPTMIVTRDGYNKLKCIYEELDFPNVNKQ